MKMSKIRVMAHCMEFILYMHTEVNHAEPD